MSLNYEQKQRLKEWAERAKLKCSVCSGSSLKFGDLIPGVSSTPTHLLNVQFVQGTCSDCGHVMLFNRTIIGV